MFSFFIVILPILSETLWRLYVDSVASASGSRVSSQAIDATIPFSDTPRDIRRWLLTFKTLINDLDLFGEQRMKIGSIVANNWYDLKPLATGHTSLCHRWFETADDVTVRVEQRKHLL